MKKKLFTLTLTLSATLLLGACGAKEAKEEVTTFKQEYSKEDQSADYGTSTAKITHEGEKIKTIVFDTETPLNIDLGTSPEDMEKAIKEIEDDKELTQEEKDTMIAAMKSEQGGAENTDVGKMMDEVYGKMKSSKGVEVKTNKSKDTYKVTFTIDFEKADKAKLGEYLLPVELSSVKEYKSLVKELETLQFKEQK
ncbi:hypothetical protein SAMN02745116_02346 [Pilibacter termitis]|uniref:Lipoprotein n=1 Tax=Pilibacter termitis TaxID=263852 RepID=A0A1T4QVT1_9ENTE|nr:hypothetical protein [Pilibacter termitis]SKA07890.1 hypothetical protein SAMN02745116_02346 [Pilibacter termitis]